MKVFKRARVDMQFDENQSGPEISIYGLDEMPEVAHFDLQLDHIFYTSSATKTFPNELEREVFRERWLGRYLVHDSAWFYVALTGEKVVGYLAGSIDDPARQERFADVGYLPQLADQTARYPAHLHINIHADWRSTGLGARLIERLVFDLQRVGVPGVHLVTSRFSRNVSFYERNGFAPVRILKWGDGEILMLGRLLTTV